jgi:monoamine oxidase
VSEFKLGQRVRFTRPMARRPVGGRNITVTEGLGDRTWERERFINRAWEPDPYAPEREGIIIGKRTLSNGHHYWESEGYGEGYWINEPAEHFTAYLIAFDLHRKPVHVLPEHITSLAAAA